ncbi:hypothetical protein N9X24_00705, partial [Rickettsiales bacterium]|nr:hypothetical protein [Rickettsiales bacterium]
KFSILPNKDEKLNANLLCRVPLELAKFANWVGDDPNQEPELLNPEIYAKCLFQFLSGKIDHKNLRKEDLFKSILEIIDPFLKERGIDNDKSYDAIGSFFQIIVNSLTIKPLALETELQNGYLSESETESQNTYLPETELHNGYLEDYIKENRLTSKNSKELEEAVIKFINDFKSQVSPKNVDNDSQKSPSNITSALMANLLDQLREKYRS